MVERRKCPSDGRGSLARLTDEGMACLEAAAPTHVAGVRRYFVDPLTGAQQAGLAESLQVIERELAQPSGGCPPCPGEPAVS
jgi:DNA-binding MarR family transcriptional regulator